MINQDNQPATQPTISQTINDSALM